MKKVLLGNEAIVQGALEAGVDFVSAYPGTPSSEIGNIFGEIAKKNNVYFEFSTNEKTALEAAIGASFSGLKCLVAMKSFGLNVASDALLPFVYTGTKGPVVIIAADDPSCWSSGQTEENSRGFAYLAHIPVLEPSDAQEAKDFVKLGFEISEKFNIPVIVRTTTRVAHQRMPVEINSKLQIPNYKEKGIFIKDVKRFVTMPPRVLEMKDELLAKIEKIREYAEKSEINRGPTSDKIRGRTSDKLGIITSGVSYLYVKEILEELSLDLPILKLGFFYPLPKKKISSFIKGLKKVLIVEELEGYLEKEVKVLAKEINPKLKVFGKDLLPESRELGVELVVSAIAKLLNKKLPIYRRSSEDKEIPKRFPRLCPNCPYWFVFSAVKEVAPKDTIFGGDIGCYMIAGFPPHNIQDYLLCMGSSIGIAHGIKKASAFAKASADKQKLISFIGDSTFFHSGIPALINTVFNKSNPLIIIMDNRITAMTGHQPNPGMGLTGMLEPTEEIKIEEIVKACGVKNIKVIDPKNIDEFKQTVKEFLNKEEVSVIIAKRICVIWEKRLEALKKI
jgi:indolepyruvate ferredoxin oxidoreductase alpha subunit